MKTKPIPTLKAVKRTAVGSRESSALREQGAVPVNLYGQGTPNAELTLNAHDLGEALKLVPAMLKVESPEGTVHGLIKELQYDVFGTNVLHVDMKRVNLEDLVTVAVPLEFYGIPKGTEAGGKLEVLKSEVMLRVRADSIPELFRINAADLGMDEALHFSDVPLTEGMELISNPEGQICICRISRRAAALAKRAAVAADKKKAK